MELSLDLSSFFVPKTLSEFLRQVSTIKDKSRKLSKIDDYCKRLEEEMRKIHVFKRELPLSMLLLTDAIERLKEEAMHCTEMVDRSVVDGFNQIKGVCDVDGGVDAENSRCDKRDWLSSVQLWGSISDSEDNIEQHYVSPLKLRDVEDDRSIPETPIRNCSNRNKVEGGFAPNKTKSGFTEKEQITCLSLMPPNSEFVSSDSVPSTNICCKIAANESKLKLLEMQQQQQQRSYRKQRRCWSSELHRKFVDVLQQLGGSKVATPKLIREVMQVEGLTNDEVKSHLQKYRLHVRKHPGSSLAVANALWLDKNHCGNRMKQCDSQSVSPQGPLVATGSAKGNSSSGGESMVEGEEDEKSDGHSWKGGVQRPEEVVFD